MNRKYKHIHLDLKEIPIKIEEATHGEKTMNSDKKRIRNLRILVGLLIAFIAVDFIGSYGIYNENIELKKAKEQRSEEAMQLDEAVQFISDEVDSYKFANEQLIKYSTPCSVTKAVKHTPLPTLKRV